MSIYSQFMMKELSQLLTENLNLTVHEYLIYKTAFRIASYKIKILFFRSVKQKQNTESFTQLQTFFSCHLVLITISVSISISTSVMPGKTRAKRVPESLKFKSNDI